MSHQDQLRESWLGGAEDRLSGREQAKAWALREVWRAEGKNAYGLCEFVAARLRKTKNGKPQGDHPSSAAVQQLYEKMDDDPHWFPGKHNGAKRGPKRLLNAGKRAAIVTAAKRLKRAGTEPTYAAVVAACPNATRNPETDEPVDKKLIYAVFRESCYDEDPSDPWDHLSRLSRSALTEAAKAKRLAFATHVLALNHPAQWYFKHVVWCDLCNSILPRTKKKATELALARKGGKGRMSKASQDHSQHLRMPKHVLKLNSSDTMRIWWVPILARGKLHIEHLPDTFPGETQEGAECMVARVKAALRARCPGSAPKFLFTDRGNGFYNAGTGAITAKYSSALRQHGLKAFVGNDASVQPGELQEVMLHETGVAWMRVRLAKTVPRNAWEEVRDAYRTRLKSCAAYSNVHYDVEGLCRPLPERLQELAAREGDRLRK